MDCGGDTRDDVDVMNMKHPTDDDDECPEIRASFLSRLTFWWFNSLTILAYRTTLQVNSLWQLNPEYCAKIIAEKFDKNRNIHKRCEQKSKQQQQNSIGVVRTLIRTYGWQFFASSLIMLTMTMINFVPSQLLKLFIDFLSTPTITDEQPIWHGATYATSFFIILIVQSLLSNYYYNLIYHITLHVRTALISTVYRKSLQLCNSVRRTTVASTGEIVNHISSDAQRFIEVAAFLNFLWSAPLQIVLTMYFLWLELGPSILVGVAVLILLIPINAYLSTITRGVQHRQMQLKDERVRWIAELLNSIKVIKFYAWEVPLMRKVDSIRGEEMKHVKRIIYLNCFCSIIWSCAPFLVAFVTFAVYVHTSSSPLDAKKVFVSLSLYSLLRMPLIMLPKVISNIVLTLVSARRLDHFLQLPQLEQYVERKDLKRNTSGGGGDGGDGDEVIRITGGTFSWERDDDNDDDDQNKNNKDKIQDSINNHNVHTLRGIDLRIKKGSLVAIVGHVGSGKSSLLSALLGEMIRHHGEVMIDTNETLAYVSQQCWIQNATFRDNILFGNRYDRKLYRQVVRWCALLPDIAQLPGGDRTEIGERGISLSGGQKARVALARACYARRTLILLDDPLAAVDSHVGQHIFHHVISNRTGYLRDCTRLLVTNNIALLPQMDQVVVLSNGTISEIGTYDDLMSSGSDGDSASVSRFAEFIRKVAEQQQDDKEQKFDTKNDDYLVQNDDDDDSVVVANNNTTTNNVADVEVNHHRKLIEKESLITGTVKWRIYLNYIRSFTITWTSILLFGYIGMQCSLVGSNVWLAMWSADYSNSMMNDTTTTTTTITTASIEHQQQQRNYRLLVYGMFGLTQMILFLTGAFAMAQGAIQSSCTIHHTLLYRLLRSPLSFFHTTPVGRILNRFANDIATVDVAIPRTLDYWLVATLEVTSTLVLITIQIPTFISILLPLAALYLAIQKYYIATSRQLKRLESNTQSPIYSHFSETLFGSAIIRAFGVVPRFVAQFHHYVDQNQRCYFPSFIAQRWLAVRLELCTNLLIFFITIFVTLSRETFGNQAEFVALMLNYALSITSTLNWAVRVTSDMETNLIAVERIGEYCANATEREWNRKKVVNGDGVGDDPVKLNDDWPSCGEINFINYSVRYRDELDLVLDGIELHIKGGEKIGIVGRTGSGKSSLTLALFRLLESANGDVDDGGRIEIDGVDISRIGLHELRSKLSIIPQDPILFSGTIRTNLDPFGTKTDKELWRALEHCHLRTYIESLDDGLDHNIAEHGKNLSFGQRQLICLGRALLHRTRILVLDEATAAIDLETDALIQDTIRREYANATVLTIAHRLHTIMDSDRVLVLDHGRVAEFDTPATLLADRRSKFYSLAKDAGIV